MFRYAYSTVLQVVRLETYRRLLYLVSGGFYGVVYYGVPKVVLAFDVVPVVAWVCAPILVVASGFVRPLRNFERWWANTMLGTSVLPSLQITGKHGVLGQRSWRRALGLTRGYEPWRAAAWFTLRALFGSQALLMVGGGLVTLTLLIWSAFSEGFPNIAASFGFAASTVLLLLVPLLLAVCLFANLAVRLHSELVEPLLGPPAEEQLAILNQLNDRLQQRNDLFRERHRLANALHDSIGSDLTAVHVQAAAAKHLFYRDQQFAFDALAKIEEVTRASLKELSRMVAVLGGDSIASNEQPGLEALSELLARMEKLGLPLEVEVSGDITRVPEYSAQQAYRIAQEGCTNVLRHTGLVPTEVLVRIGERHCEVVVTNEPPSRRAFAPDDIRGGRRGLQSIEYEVNALGGLFEAGPTPQGGYKLRVLLPMGIGTG